MDTKIDSGHFGFRVLGTSALNQKPFKHAAVKFEPLISSDVSKDPNLLNIPDFIIKNDELVFTIPEGVWKIKESVVLPENSSLKINAGTTIDFVNSSRLVSYGSIQIIGEPDALVNIISSDKTGQGINILNSSKKSLFHTQFLKT